MAKNRAARHWLSAALTRDCILFVSQERVSFTTERPRTNPCADTRGAAPPKARPWRRAFPKMPNPKIIPPLDKLQQRVSSLDSTVVDQLYGLEPVFEPAGTAAALGEYLEFLCPYCCENVGAAIDLTAGSRSFIEDCQVCCQPYEITLQIDERGELTSIDVQRSD
jgi:Cysteine-rich CPXCG